MIRIRIRINKNNIKAQRKISNRKIKGLKLSILMANLVRLRLNWSLCEFFDIFCIFYYIFMELYIIL